MCVSLTHTRSDVFCVRFTSNMFASCGCGTYKTVTAHTHSPCLSPRRTGGRTSTTTRPPASTSHHAAVTRLVTPPAPTPPPTTSPPNPPPPLHIPLGFITCWHRISSFFTCASQWCCGMHPRPGRDSSSPSSSSSSLFLSSPELSDATVNTPYIRALLGTASHFCKVVVLKLRPG